MTTQLGDMEGLSNARLISATEELNQIADDIRDNPAREAWFAAVPLPEVSTPAH